MRITIEVAEYDIEKAIKSLQFSESGTDADTIEEEGNEAIDSSQLTEDEKHALKEKWHNEVFIFKQKLREEPEWNEDRVRDEIESELENDPDGILESAVDEIICNLTEALQDEMNEDACEPLKEKLEELKYTCQQ